MGVLAASFVCLLKQRAEQFASQREKQTAAITAGLLLNKPLGFALGLEANRAPVFGHIQQFSTWAEKLAQAAAITKEQQVVRPELQVLRLGLPVLLTHPSVKFELGRGQN